MSPDRIRQAIKRVLRPLVRALISRGLTYPQLTEMLKELYIAEAAAHFGIEGKRMTDSRLSILTGLQRRDIRAHRDAPSEEDGPRSIGPIPRVIAHWTSDSRYVDEAGPLALPRAGEDLSFEALVGEIGRDVHPRTILDEMVRLGLAEIGPVGHVALTAESLVPSANEALLMAYFGANLGDHAEAAASNLLAAPAPGPFYERAVHYNKLTPTSVDRLEAMARERSMALLRELNAEALARQRAEAGSAGATERFRAGAYVYRSRSGEPGT